MWLYYGLPILTGWQGLSAVNSVALGLSLYAGSILAEILRAGILSIGRGQWDAGRAIGMRPAQVFRRIVLPQAVVRMLPAFGNAFIFSIKTSSLAYAFGVHELLRQVEALSGFTLRRAEVFTAGAVIYFLIILSHDGRCESPPPPLRDTVAPRQTVRWGTRGILGPLSRGSPCSCRDSS
jgi:polar amino acid transport system permease protein